ncbi:unnamed protein product [Nippostrongylus brasiliensis]|uniref:Zf-RVT domain-containing protein n=1 Tax=Nippostrongylus brasiliensis TaxID=27835 RepID=A0A0N4YKD7_NIPBR|nr:unnamed protein product [Nippostrongylus brasiliensis]
MTGYYRCVNKHGKNRVVSSMYYLDVISRINIKMIKSKLDELPPAVNIEEKALDGSLVAKPEISPWSECSKCGEEVGEQTRSIKCAIKKLVQKPLNPSGDWLAELPPRGVNMAAAIWYCPLLLNTSSIRSSPSICIQYQLYPISAVLGRSLEAF